MSTLGTTNILDQARDKVTGALGTVSGESLKAHLGLAYSVSHSENNIAVGGKFYYQITTGTSPIYLKDYSVFSDNISFIVRMYEDPDNDPVGGTVLTTLNRNRASTNVSSVTAKENVTPDLTGASLIDLKNYATTNVELILAPSTTYLIEVENLHTDVIDINTLLYWYE